MCKCYNSAGFYLKVSLVQHQRYNLECSTTSRTFIGGEDTSSPQSHKVYQPFSHDCKLYYNNNQSYNTLNKHIFFFSFFNNRNIIYLELHSFIYFDMQITILMKSKSSATSHTDVSVKYAFWEKWLWKSTAIFHLYT